MSHARAPRPAHEVRIWHARTDDVFGDDRRRARALDWLRPSERARFDRFRLEADRDMFLLGRVMARALVGRALGVNPLEWPWREGERGRPEIADDTTSVHFNLAHSAGCVVAAVSPTGPVGVDVENRHRRTVDAEVVRRFCAPAEIADIEAQGAQWHDRFLIYWTLKEAYLKARGLGIAVHLSDLSFQLDTQRRAQIAFLGSLAGTDAQWAFELVDLEDRHVLAVAAPTSSSGRPTFDVSPMPAAVLS